MVHNGIEYGIMAAYAEGFNILRHANAGKQTHAIDAETTPMRRPELYAYDMNLPDIAEVLAARQRDRVVASGPHRAVRLPRQSATSRNLRGRVSDSGEGRWTIAAAIDESAFRRRS